MGVVLITLNVTTKRSIDVVLAGMVMVELSKEQLELELHRSEQVGWWNGMHFWCPLGMIIGAGLARFIDWLLS